MLGGTLTAKSRWWLASFAWPPFVAVLLLAGCSSDLDDGALVRCMSPQYRAQLVQAAVTLGLVKPESSVDLLAVGDKKISLETWRTDHNADFERSCNALVNATQAGSAQGGGGGSNDALVAIFAAVIGALATGLAAAWPSISGRHRLQSDDLRRAALDFGAAGQAYVDGWVAKGRKPPDGAFRLRQRELAAQVRRVALLHPSWRVPGQLSSDLFQEPFDDMLTRRWVETPDTEAYAARLRHRLGELGQVAEQVAEAVESPVRHWRRMRKATR